MEKQNKESRFGLLSRLPFRPQGAVKKAFGDGVGCRAKAGEFEAVGGALEASI